MLQLPPVIQGRQPKHHRRGVFRQGAGTLFRLERSKQFSSASREWRDAADRLAAILAPVGKKVLIKSID
ncbi:unnamed protein product [Arabis nemorensis]|uniref:Uncharacterized protein n=1 Tax=Arabis nemorensis TaxID=586526 RepID=A0A565B475_9BRAS|nr:unnamed protein product [Arabis nemorensis]